MSQPATRRVSTLVLPVTSPFPKAFYRSANEWGLVWLYVTAGLLSGWKIGLQSEDQPLRIRPGSDKQTLANGRFGGVARLCGLDWSYKRSSRVGGKKVGGSQPETQRQCGGQGRQQATHRPALLPQPCRLLPAHPAGRYVCRRVDRPVDSLTFLPGAPPLEVRGVGRKAMEDFVESF